MDYWGIFRYGQKDVYGLINGLKLAWDVVRVFIQLGGTVRRPYEHLDGVGGRQEIGGKGWVVKNWGSGLAGGGVQLFTTGSEDGMGRCGCTGVSDIFFVVNY